jgi:poly-beta-1,6-N-acetyl-D-glucosamine N-deacetylase
MTICHPTKIEKIMIMIVKKIKKRCLCAVLACLFGSVVAAEELQAVVLMYHHFGVSKYPSTNVTLEQFEAHLRHLEEADYQVWPLRKVVDYVLEKRPFPAKVVAISIDDAYASVFEEAYPRLKKRGWPFTVFVASDGVDQHFPAYMSWSQMREMQAHGVSFENHSASHDYLIRAKAGESEKRWQQRIGEDIARAQRRITTELGVAPGLFAYPYGEYNQAVAALVGAQGLTAFGQQSGPVGLGMDPRALPRFPMAERFAGLDDFKQKARSLAFPLVEVRPWEVHLQQGALNSAPKMWLQLAESDAQLEQLTCYVSGQGAVAVTWQEGVLRQFMLQAPRPLLLGRSRYNCTAPSAQRGRYYWFSHLWIRTE